MSRKKVKGEWITTAHWRSEDGGNLDEENQETKNSALLWKPNYWNNFL